MNSNKKLVLFLSTVLVVCVNQISADRNFAPFKVCHKKSDGTCSSTCGIRNSTCGLIVNGDSDCGCIYCNYDRVSRSCVGKCVDRQLTQCVSRIPTPRKDSDCQCFRCKTDFDVFGNAICSGNCLTSSLVCKPKLFNFGKYGSEFWCSCQSADTPNPNQNFCRYRHTFGRCAGNCLNGTICSSENSNSVNCICLPNL